MSVCPSARIGAIVLCSPEDDDLIFLAVGEVDEKTQSPTSAEISAALPATFDVAIYNRHIVVYTFLSHLEDRKSAYPGVQQHPPKTLRQP
jgi:hypothetical protein